MVSCPGPCASSGGCMPEALFMVFLLDSKGPKVQKFVNFVDLVESFLTSIQYLLAKIGFDAAENGPLKVCHKLAKRSKNSQNKHRARGIGLRYRSEFRIHHPSPPLPTGIGFPKYEQVRRSAREDVLLVASRRKACATDLISRGEKFNSGLTCSRVGIFPRVRTSLENSPLSL